MDAYPVGRVRLETPGFLALTSGEIEARFEIAADGSSKVTLLRATGNVAVDNEALEYLRSVRWQPKTVNGIPVADSQDLEFTANNG